MFKAVHKEKRIFKNLTGLCLTGLLAWVSIAGWPSAAGTATSDSANLQANYEIVSAAPLTLLNTSDDLDFGQIEVGDDIGDDDSQPDDIVATVTLTPDTGVRSVSPPPGPVTLIGGTNFKRAQFSVTGEPSTQYNISIVNNPLFVHDQSTGTIALEALLSHFHQNSQNEGPIDGLGKTDATGNDTVFVGGDMKVTANAVSGGYEGIVEITVSNF